LIDVKLLLNRARGYTERFGVHYVNFSDPERPRTPKASAALLTKIYKDNGFPDESEDKDDLSGSSKIDFNII